MATKTEAEIIADLNAIAVQQHELAVKIQAAKDQIAANAANTATLVQSNATLTAANTALAADKAAMVAQLSAKDSTISGLQAQIVTLNNRVLALEAELAAAIAAGTGGTGGTGISPEVQAAVDAAKAASQASSNLFPGGIVTPPPVTPTDAAIIAELSDNTKAGFDKRLGKTAAELHPDLVVPDVWERPKADIAPNMGTYMAKYSQGLGVQTTERFDYGSTEFNGLYNPDVELIVTAPVGKTTDDPKSTVNAGTGVYRLRTEEHSGGVVSEFPAIMWNSPNGVFPDRDSVSHVLYNMHAKLGRPVAEARAKINRYDVGFVLYDRSRGGAGFWGAVGTQTAYPSWAGAALPAGKIPLSIALSSMNEFLFVGVHDEATGKGQIGVYWLWSGNDLLSKQNKGFPFDFPVAHPGLMNSGMIAGTKLFGFFDVPVKYPTNIDAVCTPGANTRIQGFDGNASYLNIWQLGTDAQRAAFLVQNGTWIPTWMKVAVSSKYENKAVTVDFTALSAGVRDQYFGSQAKYDQTAYQKPSGTWDAYTLTDPMVFPWGIEAKPEWAPTIKAVFDVPTPNYMIMREKGDAAVACACADGKVRFYTFDGAPNGEIYVGDNPVHMSHDKYPSGPRNGGPVVTCRGSRSVVILSTWGPTAAILMTIQDKAMLDPVSTSVGDTHGVQMRYLQVSDRNGRKLINYRASDLKLATQGGAVYKMGPDGTSSVERGGWFDIPGYPIGGTDSNVN